MKLFDENPESDAFASGKTCVRYGRPNNTDVAPKLMVPVIIEEKLEHEAMLDTGAQYLILSPAATKELDLLSNEHGYEEAVRIRIRGSFIDGKLKRIRIRFQTVEGGGAPFDATAFVPDDETGSWGDLPLFIGYYNCLDRIRIALEPGVGRDGPWLYFSGPLE